MTLCCPQCRGTLYPIYTLKMGGFKIANHETGARPNFANEKEPIENFFLWERSAKILPNTLRITAVKHLYTDWYEIWALTDHENHFSNYSGWCSTHFRFSLFRTLMKLPSPLSPTRGEKAQRGGDRLILTFPTSAHTWNRTRVSTTQLRISSSAHLPWRGNNQESVPQPAEVLTE